MLGSHYEYHTYQDPNFHIIFHTNTLTVSNPFNHFHWHESIEIIYVVEGTCTIFCGLMPITAYPGEIVVINCNELHRFEAQTTSTTYYCLIVNQLVHEKFGLNIDDVIFEHKITTPTITEIYKQIVAELNHAKPYYQLAVKTQFTYLLIQLLRDYVIQTDGMIIKSNQDSKINMIKEAIHYIRKHLTSQFTLEDICQHIGFSKHYFCHIFKEVTHQTVTQYINYLRCQYAKELLLSGDYTVAEVSELCGYNHLTYFSKNFKKHIGKSPSYFKP